MNFWKFNFKRNTLLLRFFLCLSLISAFSIILLTITMFYMFREKAKEDFNKVNKIILLNIDVAFNTYIDFTEKYAIELYHNPQIKNILLQKNFELTIERYNYITQINNTLTVNNYINSVYFLNESNVVLSLSKKFTNDSTINELFSIVSSRSMTEGPLFWSMKSRYTGKTDIKTLTVFYHEGVLKDGNFGGAVVVNIDLDELKKNIFSEQINKNQKFYIVDNNDNILLNSSMDDFETDNSSLPYIKNIKSLNSNYGTFSMEVGGQQKVISYATSSNGNYYAISEMEYIQSISDLLKATNYFIFFGVVIFLITVFISVFISYVLYKPFVNIFGNIRNMFGDSQNKNNLNEVQLLSDTFTKMVDKLNSLEKENDNNEVIKMLSSRDNLEEAFSTDILLKTGILEKETSPYIIVVVKIDEFEAMSENYNREAILFQLNSVNTIVIACFSGMIKCTAYQIEDDQIVIIVSEIDESSELQPSYLTELMQKARDTVQKLAHISVTIGISNVSQNALKINERYLEACVCTKYRLFMGTGAVVSKDMISQFKNSEISENIVQDVLNSVKTSNKDEFDILMNNILKTCSKYTYEKVVIFLSNLSVAIIELSKDILHEEIAVEKTNYLEIYNKIFNFDDPDTLKEWFYSLYERANFIINDLSNKKIHNILIEIIEYINQHYYDSQISANLMADKLSISTQYFSKIFNEFTGSSLPEYVNNIRLERAREMLIEDKNMDIYEIADKVGYRSNTYFTTSFKRKYGITPSKLRLSWTDKK